MWVCAVLSCPNRGVHSFPHEQNLRRLWVKATKVNVQKKIGSNMLRYSSICAAHFKPDDYELRGSVRLKKNAVPSIFPWTTKSDIKDKDEFIFKPEKVVKTYSKSEKPVTFVEEYRFLNIQTTEVDDDPLSVITDSINVYPGLAEVICINADEKDSATNNLTNNIEPTEKDTVTNNNDTTDKERENIVTTTENTSSVNFETSLADMNKENNTEEKNTKVNNTDENNIDVKDSTTISENNEINTDQTKTTFCDNCEKIKREFVSDSIKSPFSVHRYKDSDDAINFFTGLENYGKLTYVFSTLGGFIDCPTHKLNGFEQFFMTLMMLRRHTDFEEVSMLYLISVQEVKYIFKSWISLMSSKWRKSSLWGNDNKVVSYIFIDFYVARPVTKVVMDKIKLLRQANLHYKKNRHAIKCLIGVAANGLITYFSRSNEANISIVGLSQMMVDRDDQSNEKIVDKICQNGQIMAEDQNNEIMGNKNVQNAEMMADIDDQNDNIMTDTDDQNDKIMADICYQNDEIMADEFDQNDKTVADIFNQNDEIVAEEEDENHEMIAEEFCEITTLTTEIDQNEIIVENEILNVQQESITCGKKVKTPKKSKKNKQIKLKVSQQDTKTLRQKEDIARIIKLLKSFKILKQSLNLTQANQSFRIAFVCAMLVNFQSVQLAS